MVNEIFEKLSALPQVEAIALGGSRANGVFDEKSDYDVYVYVTDNIDNGVRKISLRLTVRKWKSAIIIGSLKTILYSKTVFLWTLYTVLWINSINL